MTHRPALALVARALRAADGTQQQARELGRLISGHKNRPLAAEDAGGPTPETVVHHRRRLRGDTVEQLVANRRLQWHLQGAAEQIARIFESVAAPLWSRSNGWELGRIDSSKRCRQRHPERLAGLYARKFLPWARWMSDTNSRFQCCTKCGRTLTIPAVAYRMRRTRALRLLQLGLDRYADFA